MMATWQVPFVTRMLEALAAVADPVAFISCLMQAARHFMQRAANVDVEVRLALLDEADRSKALLFRAERAAGAGSAGSAGGYGRARAAAAAAAMSADLPSLDPAGGAVATAIDLRNTLLASTVASQKARFVRDTAAYMQLCAAPARDVFTAARTLVASLVVVPLVVKGVACGAMYFSLGAPCDFGGGLQDALLGLTASVTPVVHAKLAGRTRVLWGAMTEAARVQSAHSSRLAALTSDRGFSFTAATGLSEEQRQQLMSLRRNSCPGVAAAGPMSRHAAPGHHAAPPPAIEPVLRLLGDDDTDTPASASASAQHSPRDNAASPRDAAGAGAGAGAGGAAAGAANGTSSSSTNVRSSDAASERRDTLAELHGWGGPALGIISEGLPRYMDADGATGTGAPNSCNLSTVSSRRLHTGAMMEVVQSEIRRQHSRAAAAAAHAQGASGSLSSASVASELQLDKCIGAGGYGSVYRGQWKKTTAAIKVFYSRSCEREAMKDAVEMAVLSSVQHPNIVSVYSCMTDMIETAGDFDSFGTSGGGEGGGSGHKHHAATGAAGAAGGSAAGTGTGTGGGGDSLRGALRPKYRRLLPGEDPEGCVCSIVV